MQDYKTPEGKVLSRDLASQLNTAIQFLVECRPLSVSMGNAIKFLKLQVGSTTIVRKNCLFHFSTNHTVTVTSTSVLIMQTACWEDL